MPGAVTTASTAKTKQGNARSGQAPPTARIPFIVGAQPHSELISDQTLTMTTGQQGFTTIQIPAYGYLRNIYVHVTATAAGNAATVAFAEDSPLNAIANIMLLDVNGLPLIGPLTGFDLHLVRKWLEGFDDLASTNFLATSGTAAAAGSLAAILKIPVEIIPRTGLGCLPNLNASSAYQLAMTLNSSGNIYGTAPTTLPAVRIRVYAEFWSEPLGSDSAGHAQETQPPGYGTVQSITKQNYPYAASQTSAIRLTRVGNMIRALIFVARRNSSTRVNGEADWPDTVAITLDSAVLETQQANLWREQLQVYGNYTTAVAALTANAKESGVYLYTRAYDLDQRLRQAETTMKWLRTVQASRLEFVPSSGFAANAGNLDVITIDVAPRGNVQAAASALTSPSGAPPAVPAR